MVWILAILQDQQLAAEPRKKTAVLQLDTISTFQLRRRQHLTRADAMSSGSAFGKPRVAEALAQLRIPSAEREMRRSQGLTSGESAALAESATPLFGGCAQRTRRGRERC